MANYWYSPFFIDQEIINKLESFGYSRINNLNNPNDKFIVIFKTPDEVISDYIKNNSKEDYIKILQKGILEVKNFSNTKKLISLFQLKNFSENSFRDFIKENNDNFKVDNQFPDINPISALICLDLFQKYQDILNSYLDIELICFRLSESNENYIYRLNKSLINNNPVEYMQKLDLKILNCIDSSEELAEKLELSENNLELCNVKLKQILEGNEKMMINNEKLNNDITLLIQEKNELMNKYSSAIELLKNRKQLINKGLNLIKKFLEINKSKHNKFPSLISDISDIDSYN